MKYDMKMPCANCPFLREGGIHLTQTRVRKIGGMMLNSAGGEFPCHLTVEYGDETEAPIHRADEHEKHCAGALIFAEKNGTSTQMMRIAERLGMYDAQALMTNDTAVEAVFDCLDEMLDVNKAEGRTE